MFPRGVTRGESWRAIRRATISRRDRDGDVQTYAEVRLEEGDRPLSCGKPHECVAKSRGEHRWLHNELRTVFRARRRPGSEPQCTHRRNRCCVARPPRKSYGHRPPDRTERLEAAEPPSKFRRAVERRTKERAYQAVSRDEQEALLKNGLSAEFRNALKDSGLTDDEIQTVEAEMKKQAPEEVAEKFEQRIARRKFRNELAAQEKNKRRSSIVRIVRHLPICRKWNFTRAVYGTDPAPRPPRRPR